MKISTALANVTRLGVETSPFIYLVEQHPAYISRIRTIFQQIETEKL